MLVRVLTDNGGPKPVPLLARVVEERDDSYTIVYLSKAEEDEHNRTVYRYEDDHYEIDDDYVIEYLDDEAEAGFERYDDEGGWVKRRRDDTSDDDYEPSGAEEDDEADDDEESLEDENEDYEGEEEYYDD